jgi:CRISPR-associated protein Cas1
MKKQYAYQTVLIGNVQMRANYIAGKRKELQFSMPQAQLGRNDDMGNFILNMTPEQRKKLGINKSTLWYIQKNLREGKKVKLYDKVRAKIV